jgi:TonB-linked SusC/RagA family outer membrane protein
MGITSVAAVRRGVLVLALLALAPFVATRAFAQQRITGRVSDAADNRPIPAAAVLVTGTTIGQNSSDSGTFSFNVPADAKTFVVRRIGYLAQTVLITAGKTEYTVVMQRDILRLETQVVTGVATSVASQNAANAVAVVNTQEVNQVPAPTLENSLEGKIPGAVVENNNGGAPGGSVEVQVRGVTSIFGNSEPLYVVDGVIVNNQTVNADENAINRSGGGVTATGQASSGAPSSEDNGVNRIADINPDDIENIEVLKGASASAIYGSRASAGVIVITTKRGTTGKPRWNFSGQVGHYQLSNEYPYRSFPTLASAQAWYANDIKLGADKGAALAADNAFISSIYAPGQNYQRQLFGNGQAAYQADISVSGSSGGTQYFLSGLTKYDNGTMLNTGYAKQSLNTSVTQQFAQALTVTAGGTYIHDLTRRGISGNDNIGISPYNFFSYTPQIQNLARQNADGSWPINQFGTANAVADAIDIETPQEVSRFIGHGNINWTPWKTEHQALSFNAIGGADLSSFHALLYAPPFLQVEQQIYTGLPGTSVSNDATINYFNYSLNLTYHNTVLPFLDATTAVGWTRDKWTNTNPVVIGYNLLAGVNSPTAGTILNSYFYHTAQYDQSFYVGEQILTAGSRLALTGGVTSERSTSVGDINKFYYYPHFAGSYRIPQFVGFMDELKLRVATGQAGNLPTYGQKYTPYNQGLLDGVNGVQLPSLLGDAHVKPESSTETEMGFDATMFKSRAQFSATVYQKRLTSLLLQAGVAPSHGYTNIFLNGGEFTNQGIELSFLSTPLQLRNGFTWTNTFTFARNYSVVNSIPVPRFFAGRSFGFGSDLIAPGRSLTDIVDPNFKGPSGLNVQVGDFAPGYVVTMSNEFNWKGFRVFGLLDWSRGGNTINLTDTYFDTGPQLGTDSVAAANRLNAFVAGYESYVQTASFLKVREIAASYNLPASMVSKYGFGRLSSARISFEAYNLFSIFHYHGLDPQVSAFGNQAIGRGYDVTPFPPNSSYYLGLDLVL